jgi:hypothetical protein
LHFCLLLGYCASFFRPPTGEALRGAKNANGGVVSPHSLKASGAAEGRERDGHAGGGGGAAHVKEEEAPNQATHRRSGRR